MFGFFNGKVPKVPKYQSLIKCCSCLAEVTAVATVEEPLQSQFSVTPEAEKKPPVPVQLLPKFSESAAE